MTSPHHQFKSSGSHNSLKGAGLAFLGIIALGYGINLAQEPDFIPLPQDVLPETQSGNPLTELAEKAITHMPSTFSPNMPDSFVIRNDHGQVHYDSAHHSITYTGSEERPVYVRTGEGHEIYALQLTADFDNKEAEMAGPLTIYQGESLTRAEHGYYNWGKEEATIENVRAKVNGLLLRGSHMEYRKDNKGKEYVVINDAFITTEDTEKPGSWIGAGKITIYPGDYGKLHQLSVGSSDYDMTIPVLGWIPLSHSLNPREGYLPLPGAKSIWGSYLLNRYGILLGNRRVEHGMPVADYVATGLLDWRSRRGYAGGFELTDEKMQHRYSQSKGLAFYYASDKKPSINPTRIARSQIERDRYRAAMKVIWDLPKISDREAQWHAVLNSTIVSDQYMLRDYFEDISRLDDKPDNAAWLTRRTKQSQMMVLARFSPNNYYSTDRRAEISYYRVRTPIAHSNISYETRNSAGVFSQYITPEQRVLYQQRINNLRYADMQDYYTRLLNTDRYFRVNTTHEITTSLNIFRFLNVTPKAGAGYSGYYDVTGVGADNRLMGYAGVDFDIKFHRHFKDIKLPSMGINGIYHIFHPYATLSHGSISGSNEHVPQMDMWSNRLGSSTINPMPLDLMSYTGIDGWGTWTVWRLGTRNTFSTVYDGESRRLLDWDLFLDYNITNPNTDSTFSNLFSTITFSPFRQIYLTIETQTPTIRNGDGFHQYNTSLNIIPVPWFEASLGHRYIKDHPVQRDSSQAYIRANLRFNEKYTAACNMSWDIDKRRLPIQQYSLFRKFGAWYMGTTVFLRNNGGKKEKGLGISFTLGETGSSLPINLF